MRTAIYSTIVVLLLLSVSVRAVQFTFPPSFSSTQNVGTTQQYSVSCDPTFYDVWLNFSTVDQSYEIIPSFFNFSASELSFNFSFVALKPEFAQISYSIGGPDEAFYSSSFIFKSLLSNNVLFTGGYLTYPVNNPIVVVPTSPFSIHLSYYTANGVTLTAYSAPPGSVVFTPSTFSFTAAGQESYDFSYEALSTGTNGAITLYYNFSGADAAFYQYATTTIFPQLRSVVTSAAYNNLIIVNVNVVSEAIRLSVNYAPPTGATLTPYSPNIIFTPPSLAFTPTTDSIQFTYVASQPGANVVSWTWSGPDAALYAPLPNKTFIIGLRPFVVSVPTPLAYAAGQTSNVFTVSTQYPPESGVTVTINVTSVCTGGSPVLSSTVLSFTPTVLQNNFTVSSNVLCSSITLTAVLSGPNAAAYAAPTFNGVLSFGKLTVSAPVNTDPTFTGVLYCGDSTSYTLSVTTPPPNGFTVMLVAPGATFTPSTFVFTPTVTTIPFEITSTFLESSITVHPIVSGTDVPLLNFIPDYTIPVSVKSVVTLSGNQYVTPGSSSLYVGTTSTPVAMTVTRAPASDITITPSAQGLTFTPAAVTFTSAVKSVLLSVYAAAAGTYTITYTLTGTDAGCFSFSSSTSLTVYQFTITMSPSTLSALTIGVMSNPYTLSIPGLVGDVTLTPQVTDVNNAPVDSYYTFSPPSIDLTPENPSATFTYITSVSRPTTDKITFVVSGTGAALVSPLTVFVGTSLQRTFTTPTYLYDYYTGIASPATFVIGIESSPFVVTVANAPPTDVSLTPFATNTLFSPSVLYFSPTVTSATFTLTTLDGAGTSFNNGQAKTISWIVGGTDADLYSTPGVNSYYAILRSTKVVDVNALISGSVFVNTPISFTITTPYAPESDLTIAINDASSAFTLSPSSVTISAGTTSTSFTATPTQLGSNFALQFALGGDVAADYAPIPNILVTTKQTGFQVNAASYSSFPLQLSYDVPSYLLNIRTLVPPLNDVTITIFSQQVEVEPSTFTFTPTTTSNDFYVEPIYYSIPVGSTTGIALHYVVSGTDAALYAAPADTTFYATLTNPLRTLTITPTNPKVAPGQPASISVTSPIPPLNSVTITPTTPQDNEYVFTPASVTFTPTVTAAIFSVQRTGTLLPLLASVPVVFVVSGTDAFLYSDPPTNVAIVPQTGQIQTGNLYSGLNLVVNQAYTTPVVLSQPPSDTLTITPAVVLGQPITFSPATITFAAGQLSSTLTLTPTAVGNSRIDFTVGGNAAPAFSFKDNYDLVITPGTVTINLNTWGFTIGGQTQTGTISLNTPPNNGLTVTPSAPGLVFSPPTIQFAAGSTLASFTVTATANSLGGSVTVTLGGPDAGLYTNPYPTPGSLTFSTGTGTVSSSVSNNGGTGLTQTLTLRLSTTPQDLPIIITPTATNVTFVPATASFNDPSITAISLTAYGTAPGSVNVFYTLSGDGAQYFAAGSNFYANPTTLTFYPYTITVTAPSSSVSVGDMSDLYRVTTPTMQLPVPVAPITITPQASIPGVTFYPPSFDINATQPSAEFQVVSPAPGSFSINYVITGPGAASYAPISPLTAVSTIRGTFTIPPYDNSLVTPANIAFIYGVSSQTYTITLRFVPENVELQLFSEHFQFTPPVLVFTPQMTAASFSFTPIKIGVGQIKYIVLGNTTFYDTPTTTTGLRVTYNVHVPTIPVLHVGQWSTPIPVTIQPPPQTTFALDVDQNGGPDVIFSPARLVFTPSATTQIFQIMAYSPTIGRPVTYSVTGTGSGLTSSPTPLKLTGTDGLDATAVQVPLLHARGILVAPAYFTVLHPRYQLDVKTTITVAVSAPPRSDVVLTMLANNINFNPPYLVFTVDGPTIQEVEVTPRHTTSYELDYASFKVDYYVTGTNANDFVVPTETLHYFAIPMGYIAAIVLVPLAFLVLIGVCVCAVSRGWHQKVMKTKSVSVN